MNKMIKLLEKVLQKVTNILMYPIWFWVAIEEAHDERIEDERLERISRSDL